ncbi:MAG TPA: AarF/UbiB family protein [Patescibacteria group bacterium]|nr:AarF/UbiB family protein [Patescibacteria group bacterium]
MYSNKYDKIIGQWTGKTYTLIRRLGAGGVGEIYLVQDSNGTILALKLSEDMISITKEYRFLCRFKDKGFAPKVYDLDDFSKQDKTYHYFTMEYIRGINLKSAIKNNTMDIKTKLNLMCIIVQILKQINEEGYIYTDLKHENIMVDSKNSLIRLIDFGSLVQAGSSVKEFTPMYDRLCWGKGKRIADGRYQAFAIAILFISLVLNKSLDPDKDKLEQIMSSLRRKKISARVFEVIASCLEGQVGDCNTLYHQISCAAEGQKYPDRIKIALNLLIAVLILLLTATIFAFVF